MFQIKKSRRTDNVQNTIIVAKLANLIKERFCKSVEYISSYLWMFYIRSKAGKGHGRAAFLGILYEVTEEELMCGSCKVSLILSFID
jgi:hypothetical protein